MYTHTRPFQAKESAPVYLPWLCWRPAGLVITSLAGEEAWAQTAHHHTTSLQWLLSLGLCHSLTSPGHYSHLPLCLHGASGQY